MSSRRSPRSALVRRIAAAKGGPTDGLVYLLIALVALQPSLLLPRSVEAAAVVVEEGGDLFPAGPTRLPSPLVLARTQSAFSVDTAANAQITLTYTLMNTQVEPVGEPLLVTTLANGVSLLSAEPEPDVDGQTLAFVLPSLSSFDQQTVTLTLGLPGGPGPLTVDGGAQAFGNLQTRAVSAEVGPATLRETLGIGSEHLRSTLDANTSDRYVLQAMGKVGCEPGELFRFVRDEIDHETYRGSLRGARGTLWSMAGNSLDQASLLIALLRGCGVPSRYASGTLEVAPAQELILSMFEPVSSVVGGLDSVHLPGMDGSNVNELLVDATQSLPGADEISDPAHDAKLLSEARQHFWVEYHDGARFVALDPSFAGADVGDSFAPTASTFVEVDDALRHKVNFKLVEEEFPLNTSNSFLAAAYYLSQSDELVRNGVKPVGPVFVQEQTVLDRTLRTVELVGEPVSFGHFVDHRQQFATVEFNFNTYSPWMQIGDSDELIRGTDYEEAVATIGILIGKIISGVFLRMTVMDPEGNTREYEHTLSDRMGFAVRSGESGEIVPDLSGNPIFSDINAVTVNVAVSRQDDGQVSRAFDAWVDLMTSLQKEYPDLATMEAADLDGDERRDITTAMRSFFLLQDRYELRALSQSSDRYVDIVESLTGTRGYPAAPLLHVAGSRSLVDGDTFRFQRFIDLRKFDIRAIANPGVPESAAFLFRSTFGLFLTFMEAAVSPDIEGATSMSAADILIRAGDQGIALVSLGSGQLSGLDALEISDEARARLRAAMKEGRTVIVPERMVAHAEGDTIAWLEVDEETGALIGVSEDGNHQDAIEFAIVALNFIGPIVGMWNAGLSALISFGMYIDDLRVISNECGANQECRSRRSHKALLEFIGGLACSIFFGAITSAFKVNLFGNLVVTGACMVFDAFLEAYIDDQYGDPPLTSLLGGAEPPTVARSAASTVVTVPAVLTSGSGRVEGMADARYYRADGEQTASFLVDPTDTALAMYPRALAGIAASGALPEDSVLPNYAPSIDTSLAQSSVNVDASEGTMTIHGTSVVAPFNVGFSDFEGTLVGTDHGLVDTVDLDGTYERVLFVEVDPTAVSASQSTGAVVTPTLESNADDDYLLTVEASPGWDVAVAADGTATITPPAGLDSGTYEVRFVARSESVPELEAEATVLVDVVAPGTPAVDVRVVEDSVFNVPQHGTLALTNYRVEIQNLSLEGDAFDVALSGLDPADYTLAALSVDVGAGRTGSVGVAFHPAAGLLAPGSLLSFSATATGRATGLTDTDTASFVYPEVVGVLPSFDPDVAAGIPGSTLTTQLLLRSAGNTGSAFSLDAFNPASLGIGGIPANETLALGQTKTLPVNLTVPVDATVGTSAQVLLTADLCAGEPVETCRVAQPSQRRARFSLLIGTPRTTCVLDVAVEAARAGLVDTSAALQEMGNALSSLSTVPGDTLLQARAVSAGNVLMDLWIANDLQDRAQSLSDLLTEIASADTARIEAALDQTCTVFDGLSAELLQMADTIAHGFDLQLLPSGRIVTPGETAVYDVRIQSTGTEPSTLDLALNGIPADVTAALSQSSVTLQPGEVVDASTAKRITVTLSSPNARPSSVAFALEGRVAERPSVQNQAPGLFAVQASAVDVTAVRPSPSVIENAGESVDVSVDLFNRANAARTVSVVWRIEDESGTTVYTGQPTSADLRTGGETTTVDLGAVDTSGFDEGASTILAQVQSETGDPLPGQEGRGVLFVGLPIVASVSAEPAEVPPGDAERVVSKVTVSTRPLRAPGAGFSDPYAKAIVASSATAAPDAALGPPDHHPAAIGIGGELILDMGTDLDRIADGSGDDLVIFEWRDAECSPTETGTYQVEVGDDAAGPWTLLGAPSGERPVGDAFDLADSGLSSARYVRLSSMDSEIAIDSVLAAHTHRPGHIAIEHHAPISDGDGIASSPVVGDMNGDGTPDIAVTTQVSGIAQCETVVLDGVTHDELLRIPLPQGVGNLSFCGNASSPALGDIDGDGTPELLIYSGTSERLFAFENDGAPIFDVEVIGPSTFSPVLENVDSDPLPEILAPGGYLESDGTPRLTGFPIQIQPIAVDLDADGAAELVFPSRRRLEVFTPGGTLVWQMDPPGARNTTLLSRPAVGDLDLDGRPEIVLTYRHQLSTERFLTAVSAEGNQLWEHELHSFRRCSVSGNLCSTDVECTGPGADRCNRQSHEETRPVIADLNGDGSPEIAVFARNLWRGPAEYGDYVVAFDANGNELWKTETRDPSGSPPMVSAADLNGDGAAEVLWNGSCSGFTILDGDSGSLLYRDPRARSGSAMDYPVAADVDADGRIEIVTGSRDGLYVFGNDLGWGEGRATWNQYDYRITNVTDDLQIPAQEPSSWLFHNTYLFQGASARNLGSAALAVEHEVGPAVSFLEADITPAPASVAGPTIDWASQFSLATGKSFSVPVEVPALRPGESAVVSQGTTVSGTLTLIDGQTIDLSVPLGPTTVTAPHILDITPETATVSAGGEGSYVVTLRNVRSTPETFSLEVHGVVPSLAALPPSVSLAAGEERSIPLEVGTESSALPGIVDFVVVASGDQGTEDEVWGRLDVTTNALAPVPAGVSVQLGPAAPTIGQGASTLVTVRVTHTGSGTETFDLTAALPPGVTGSFAEPSLTVAPGVTASKETVLVLSAAPGTPSGALDFSVTATSASRPNLADTEAGLLNVSPSGVQVTLTPEAAVVTPGQELVLSATVTNRGTVADIFVLDAGGLFATSICFTTALPCQPSHSVSLEPGASEVVDVIVPGLTAFLQQSTLLTVQATSRTTPDVVSADFALLQGGSFRGVTVSVEPSEITQTTLDPADFSLRITNSGNACDERYTMTLGSSPDGAQLIPQTTAFVVPPRLTALVTLAAIVPDYGTYTVYVDVETQAGGAGCASLPAATDSADALLHALRPNRRPVADAGPDQNVGDGLVRLDGGLSYDPDADPLSFDWTFVSLPVGSSLTDSDLVDRSTPSPSFTPDVAGDYALQLVVDDGELSDSDTVAIHVNWTPVADAGRDRNVKTGIEATLDGTDSFDPNGDLITYEWGLDSRPAGSSLADDDVAGKTSPLASFTPDVEGRYVFRLVVRDGRSESAPDDVKITAHSSNSPPNAHAGRDQTTHGGVLVPLDGSASEDPDAGPGPLTYHWSFAVRPAGSALLDEDIVDADRARAGFVPDVDGLYVMRLKVGDGAAFDEDEVAISDSPSVAPNARAGQDQTVAPGTEVVLDGSGSDDPDGEPEALSFQWRFVSVPEGVSLTNADIHFSDAAIARFTPDPGVAGSYVLELEVCDGLASDFDNVRITLEPPPACVPAPDPDLNNDGIVNILDVSLVSSCFGQDPGNVPRCEVADVDCDGVVGYDDLRYVFGSLGQSGYPVP